MANLHMMSFTDWPIGLTTIAQFVPVGGVGLVSTIARRPFLWPPTYLECRMRRPDGGRGVAAGVGPYFAARRIGGVGSLDESYSQALLSGRPFVMIDNLRGRLDSQLLEMAHQLREDSTRSL